VRLRDPKAFTHGLFRFPGRFHPPLVAYLLRMHPGAKVTGDLMVGSGTSAVESVVSGRDGIFSDIDPLSCLLTRAKTGPLEPEWVTETFESIIRKADPLWPRGASREDAELEISDMENSSGFRAPPDVFKWFQPYVAANLAKLLRVSADMARTFREKDSILAVFAAAVRRVSRADPNTASGLEVTRIRRLALRHGLRFDIAGELRKKAKLLADGYRQMNALPVLGKARVVEHDAKDWFSICRRNNQFPQIVITSPCYFSAIEYWRRHKLEYSWLGLVNPSNLKSVKGKFLGMGSWEPDIEIMSEYAAQIHADLKELGKDRLAEGLARYFEDSACWISEVGRVIEKTNGTAYVVAGSNTTHGLFVDTPRALSEIATMAGLSVKTLMSYGLKNRYMQYTTNSRRISSETVLKITPA
jgi:hypothetical protein